MNEFMRNGIRLIEGEPFYGIKSGGVGNGCNVEGECDRGR